MKHSIAKYALASVIATVLATPVWAQDSQSNDDGAADIIVTARRQEERLQDVPISITVLTSEAIAKRNISNAGDLGTYVPSLATNANFGPEKSSFAIRGFNQEGRTSPTVAVYFADVVAPRANTGTTTGNGAGVGSMFDLQNVQVLKGPQGTLFGRNTTGGAILLVPTKPTSKLEGYVEGSLGSHDMKRVQAAFNAPLGESVRMRAAMDWHKNDGYLRNRSGIGPDRLGNTDYIAARLSLVADLTPDLENYTIFRYSKSDTYGNTPKVVGAGPYPGFPASSFLPSLFAPLAKAQLARAAARGDDYWDVENPVANPREYQRTWQVINTTTWKASDNLTVKNIISYADFEAQTKFNLFGDNLTYPANYFAFFGLSHPAGTFPNIIINTGPTRKYADQSTFTEELQLIGTAAGGRLDWQLGAYLEVAKPGDWGSSQTETFITCANNLTYNCVNNVVSVIGLPGSAGTSNLKNTFNNKGIYAQATYKLSEQLSITGGIRYTMDRLRDVTRNINASVPTPGNPSFSCQNILLFNRGRNPNGTYIPLPASGPIAAECESVLTQSSNRATWLIGLDYKPSDDLLLYAKYARGYRQGTIIATNLGLETAGPETVDTYEAGAKATFGGAVPGYFNFAAFYNKFRDQQIAVNTVIARDFIGIIQPAQVIANAGRSRMWGIEIDAQVRPFDGFKLDASYAYLNTRLISITAPPLPIFYEQLTPVALPGGPLAQSPKNRISMTATYTLPLAESLGKLSIGGTFTHTDANQVHTQAFAPTQYIVQAQDYLNLNVDWEGIGGSPIDLAFFMTNVTNQKRISYPLSIYQFGGYEAGYVNLPRMWGFRLKYNFGD